MSLYIDMNCFLNVNFALFIMQFLKFILIIVINYYYASIYTADFIHLN